MQASEFTVMRFCGRVDTIGELMPALEQDWLLQISACLGASADLRPLLRSSLILCGRRRMRRIVFVIQNEWVSISYLSIVYHSSCSVRVPISEFAAACV